MSIQSESIHEPSVEGDATFPSTPAQRGDETPTHESLPAGSDLDLTDPEVVSNSHGEMASQVVSNSHGETADHTTAPQEPEAAPAEDEGSEDTTHLPEPPDPNSEPSDPDKIVSIPEDLMGERTQPDTSSAMETVDHSSSDAVENSQGAAPEGMDAAEAAESIIPDLDLAPGDDTVTHSWPGHDAGTDTPATAEDNQAAIGAANTQDEEYGGPPPDLDEGAAEASWEPDAPVSQDFDKTWQRIEDAHKQKSTLSAMVVDRVKGGLVVDIGMQGFVPASQVASGKIHDLERFIGRPLKLRITDLDRERQRVVLSARIVQEEEHLRRKRETMERLKVGLITDGVVRRLTDFGAFVDIGGTDGLLHVSEMSWSRVKHPKEVVSPGEHVKVKVLKISEDRKKISLGMRQLLPDPWNGIENQYKVGEMVSGRVVRVVPFGAFIQVRDGVDAILPNSEVSARKPKTEDLPQIGDTINAKVIEVRPEARRMTLSLRRIQEEQERKEYRDHVQTTAQTTRKTTIGDMFGDILNDWSGDGDSGDTEA